MQCTLRREACRDRIDGDRKHGICAIAGGLDDITIVRFDGVTQDTTYVRVWHVSEALPRVVTITVFAENALTRRQTELIRASTIVSSTF